MFGYEGFAIRFTDQATFGMVSFVRGENSDDDFGVSAISPMIMATYRQDKIGFFLSSGLVVGVLPALLETIRSLMRTVVTSSIQSMRVTRCRVGAGGGGDGEALSPMRLCQQ